MLTTPVRVDGTSLAVVRIAYGVVGVLSAARLLAYGWVDALYVDPPRHFTYPGFHWVPAPPGAAARVLVLTMAASAALVVVGRWYRIAMLTFLVTFTWIELVDVTTYLNHYWFMTLVGALMLAGGSGRSTAAVDRRVVWLFRAQVGVVYVFAGLAKLQGDWLLRALPLRLWLPARSDLAVVGPWLTHPETALVLSWAGALFDCTIVAFLLWRRTRLAAWCAVVAFHVATWLLFPIGVFPWLMIGMTTVFFAPDWPRRWVRRWAPSRAAPPGGHPVEAAARAAPARRFLVALGVGWLVVQVALPLRHLAYPGDARWTGEGYRFSWNVLVEEKSGSVEFRVTDRTTGRTRTTSGEHLYTPLQWRTMATEPELVRQAAHALRDDAARQGHDVEVRADVFVSINGTVARRIVDPDVDLAAEPGRLTAQPWILR